jgi:hypothetical protein
MSDHDEPVDLAAFRARREAREAKRRQREAREKFREYAPDDGRVVPPPINPDVAAMVEKVEACYAELAQEIIGFQNEISALVDAEKLHPGEHQRLLGHYQDLQSAMDAAIMDRPQGRPGDRGDDFTGNGAWNRGAIGRFADHAKYVYAVGTRDIASLQFLLAELAHTGRLYFEAHEWLQSEHAYAMWTTLYLGTTSAVRDERTWDGAWDWYDNTYSDGRQVMAQVRLKNWLELDRDFPYNRGICGDGTVLEHPRGSLCQIYPAVEPVDDACFIYHHPYIEIDLEELMGRIEPPPPGVVRQCR